MAGRNTDSLFSKITTVLSIAMAILGLLGIYINPQNKNFIIIGTALVLFLIYVIDKINQIDENTQKIDEIHKKISINEKLHLIENELAEQKGKLSMVVAKK